MGLIEGAVTPPLGIIEGFCGKPWSREARAEAIAFLAPHGYSFYFYAPKADTFLRERWQEDHLPEIAEQLRILSAGCRDLGVRFGVGLTAFDAHQYYEYGRAFADAASLVVGPDLARLLQEDISLLQDSGLDRLGIAGERLRDRYSAIDHPAAREIIRWLDGADRLEGDFMAS